MSNDNHRLPTTAEHYQTLIDASTQHFGRHLTILEERARERVEHALSKSCGGFTLTLDPNTALSPRRKIRFKNAPYLYECEREAMLEDKHGTLYALISLNDDEIFASVDSRPEWSCTHAVCVFPSSGDEGRLYLLPFSIMKL